MSLSVLFVSRFQPVFYRSLTNQIKVTQSHLAINIDETHIYSHLIGIFGGVEFLTWGKFHLHVFALFFESFHEDVDFATMSLE